MFERLRSAFSKPDFVVPDEMLAELERLGESAASIERLGKEHGSEFAHYYFKSLVESAALFEKWFPRLQSFAESCRALDPLPEMDSLTPIDQAIRRILGPKIADAERVPQRGQFTAAIFSAPLVALSLVRSDWPSQCSNAVFLTPAELRQWHENYCEPEDSQWWFCFQDWNAELDPPADSFWLEGSEYCVPQDQTGLLVTWGLHWGSLAGGSDSELWCVDANGRETLLGPLCSVDS